MAKKNTDLQTWFEAAFRAVIVVTISLVAHTYNQLNGTMSELGATLRAIELRVASIEVDRSNVKERYASVLTDIQELKLQISQLTIRTQTLADFIAKTTISRIK